MNYLTLKFRKCKECKSKISPYYNFTEYAYKLDRKIFCSYTCMQNFKQKHKHRKRNYINST